MVLQRLLNVLKGPPATSTERRVGDAMLKVATHAHTFENSAGLGMGTTPIVWPATHVVLDHLASCDELQDRIRGGRVLELGSGLGLAGIAVAATGARSVCLTDRLIRTVVLSDEGEHVMPGGTQVLDALRQNVKANSSALAGTKVVVEELAFGDLDAGRRVLADHGDFDLVLGSDITYDESALHDLSATLAQMCTAETLVLLGHGRKCAGCEAAMFDALALAGLDAKIRHVNDDSDHGQTIIVEAAAAS